MKEAPYVIWIGKPGLDGKWALLLSPKDADEALQAGWIVKRYILS